MYIYIYCIYISHKKISVFPSTSTRGECRLCPWQELSRRPLLGQFWGVSAQDSSSSSSSPGSQTSLAGRLLGKQISLRLLPLSWIVFFFFPLFSFLFFSPSFFFFLHFCFLGTKSSRLVSENTINKINHDSESLIIHDVRGWYNESVARRRSPSSLSFRGGVVTVEDLYIYTYIYICMWRYIYIYMYIYFGTQMAAQSMRRRGNLGQGENRCVWMEGPTGGSRRAGVVKRTGQGTSATL